MSNSNLGRLRKQPDYFSERYNLVRMNTFGEWLQKKRTSLRLLQSDVAARAGMSKSYVSAIERGQKHSITGADLQPDRDKVVALAKAVNGDVDEALLLCGYAPTHQTTKPTTLPELIEALERLGIEMPQFYDGIPNDPDDEAFAEAVLYLIKAEFITPSGETVVRVYEPTVKPPHNPEAIKE